MTITTKPKPLTPYYGGKSVRLAKIIASKLPDHRIYCEPFGGAAGVLMAKNPSQVEIYNDLSNGMVTLFKVVRDEALYKELIRRLELTPYARSEWQECQKIYNSPSWAALSDQVEKARIVYVNLAQSFTGTMTNGGWSFGGLKYASNVPTHFYNSIENIAAVSKRLRNVQIECQDALKIFERWDGPDTLFYLDPPYVWSTRGQNSKGRKQYEHEMADEKHLALIELCLKANGKIILSGYSSELYTEALAGAGWYHETFESFATSAVYTLANGLKGKSQEMTHRTEYLWFSPNALTTPSLWDFEREVI
jgi:DNA adenine methylase